MRILTGLLAWLFCAAVIAEQPVAINDDFKPRIAIIIDDMGNRLDNGKRAIALSGPVTINILPFTPHAEYFAKLAANVNKEVMLHIPMEAMSGHRMGKGGLHSAMQKEEFDRVLSQNLNALPEIKGVSNHMGSRLTQDGRAMEWLMSGLSNYGQLYFVDSRTSAESLALDYARKNHLRHATRDVFLDHIQTEKRMLKQWDYMFRLARRDGSALVIGHPYTITMDFLEKHLPDIEAKGAKLVSVSELLEWRQTRRNYAWQTSSSPSHKAAKN